ncbi:hypothetical protein HCX50_15985 [Microbacterium oxydans]|uniref:hypothetical protein n=1 Tax=Microbacterium sp. B19(2022) TaxID=2914045 RepID=UPI00142FCCD2|nr:hypothetical protein [Microbacterium sp. B19(2022)]NJI60930.1 hypothetical protein [Microbacterium sp. B19(2022)]
MSTVIEHKSADGKAVITDTHLIFEYNLLGRVGRMTKRSEIPLEKITGYDIIPGSVTYLRVAASGWSATPDPAKSALAFALHPRNAHDEFVSALREATGTERQNIAPPSAPKVVQPVRLPAAEFGAYKLRDGVLKGGGKSVSLQGAEAEATQGAPSQRSTLTRMGAGALIAGPVGFVVGAVARKDTSKCYVTVELPQGVVVIEGRSKDYPHAVKFADAINRSAV